MRVLANWSSRCSSTARRRRPLDPDPAAAAPPPSAPAASRPRSNPAPDPIGAIIGQPRRRVGVTAPPPAAPSLPQAAAADGSAKHLYETAYGLLLPQDYGAAEAAFDEFLQRFPSDQLAGNAQYWLGETFYVRGNFKSSAAAFLKAIRPMPARQGARQSAETGHVARPPRPARCRLPVVPGVEHALSERAQARCARGPTRSRRLACA